MEPLMSLKGYIVLENAEHSRSLLNKFYREQGYTLAIDQSVQAESVEVPKRKKVAKALAK